MSHSVTAAYGQTAMQGLQSWYGNQGIAALLWRRTDSEVGQTLAARQYLGPSRRTQLHNGCVSVCCAGATT